VNLVGSYDYTLVALSVLIAMFASYAALDLAGRVTARAVDSRDLAAAGLVRWELAFGSMHYMGCCVHPADSVAYHWPTVLLSLIAAILGSVVAAGGGEPAEKGLFRALAEVS